MKRLSFARELSFGQGNAKVSKTIFTFSLPAGWACPGALQCLAKADRLTGQVHDGSQAAFRCFAASMEKYPSVRENRWRNFEALKGLNREQTCELLNRCLPVEAKIVRIHVSGDFFSSAYFLGWCDMAAKRSRIVFYAYTKSLALWTAHRGEVPSNLRLIASEGGVWDSLIQKEGLRYARVVFSEAEAEALGLPIDHDDSLAYASDESFALLLHGTQAKGTPAAKALSALKAQGFRGYSAKAA